MKTITEIILEKNKLFFDAYYLLIDAATINDCTFDEFLIHMKQFHQLKTEVKTLSNNTTNNKKQNINK